MRVPFSWLKEFAPVEVSPHDAAQRLRQVGVPVVRVETVSKGIRGVYSGKIVSMEAHPNADKLRVAKVNLGKDTVQIVTGAPNVSQGDMIPVAKLGATLAGGKTIQEAKLRGLPSSGMMCSADELALDLKEYLPQAQREGVMILDPQTPVGIDLGPTLALDEAVLVLEPFANRPDFLSVFGVAREVAAAYGVPLLLPELYAAGKGDLGEQIKISIDDPAGCPRYIGRAISNVKVERSPLWMAARLSAAGVRPISNIVDITNYVQVELGQPLHAFDYTTLAGRTVRVRRARRDEKLVGIDGKPYALDEDVLVIADEKQPVALAGIIGGKMTEIADTTKEVFLEAATFSPGIIRRVSLKLGIRTESSRRYEKGLDIRGADWGSRRACQLFHQAGMTVSQGILDLHDKLPKPQEIAVSLTGVRNALGVGELERNQVNSVLEGLGFDIRSASPLVVESPIFRGDVREEIDVVEEIARHYGYERIPTVLPKGTTTVGAVNAEDAFDFSLRRILSSAGMTEVITFSLEDPAYLSRFSDNPPVLIRNPLTEDRKALRFLLYPEMLECVKKNLYVKNRDLAFFEIGKVFEENGEIAQKRHAAVVLTGNLPWGKEASFYTLKGLLELLWKKLRVTLKLSLQPKTDPTFHPLRFVEFGPPGEAIGFMGDLHPRILESIGIKEKVVIMELDVDQLQSLRKEMIIKAPPQYPESRRDVSMILDERAPAGEIQEAIRKAGGSLLEDVRIFDLYQGQQIPPGKKSIALALIYRSPEKTLTDDEVNRLHAKIIVQLEQTFNATLRV